MTTKLLTLIHSKIALAVLGVLLVGGSGTAVVAANHGQIPFTHSDASSTATHSPHATESADSSHAHTVAIEGTLTAYTAASQTISVQTKDSSSATTVDVNATTMVNGEHATKLSDLTAAIGHMVQVQATKQSDGKLLAWKITVSGNTTSHGSDNGASNGNGKGDGSGNNGNNGGNGTSDQQHVITGSITVVSADSFTVTAVGGSTVTVTVSASTQFQGVARDLSALKTGMHVMVEGTMQNPGAFSATRVEVLP